MAVYNLRLTEFILQINGTFFYMTKTAFIGLGVMGYPMAGHKAKAGHAVTVFNLVVRRLQHPAKLPLALTLSVLALVTTMICVALSMATTAFLLA